MNADDKYIDYGQIVPWNCKNDSSSPCDGENEHHAIVHTPEVGSPCTLCKTPFLANQYAYLVLEISDVVCWRHVLGVVGPTTAVVGN